MSADNGVYIGEFPLANGSKEWRVAEFTNSEDLYPYCDADKNRALGFRRRKYKNAPVFASLEEAETYAYKILGEMDICEYGVVTYSFDEPLG